MKKTLLATAILSGLISATAGAATVYNQDGTTLKIGGRAEVRGAFGNDVAGTMEDKSRARLNIAGETQISEGLTGFGSMEYQLEQNSDFSTRYLFAGIGTQVGDFSYGKQDTAAVLVSDMSDLATDHSGQQTYISATKERQSNMFLYSGNFINDALTVQANYIAGSAKNSDSYGAAALYALDFGLDLGLAIAAQDADESADKENQITFGAGYTLNDLYFGATYAMGDLKADEEFTSLELAAQYKLTKELRLIGTYGLAEEKDSSGERADSEDFFSVEAQYRFTGNMRTYASYKFNNLDGADEENELVVGLRYNF